MLGIFKKYKKLLCCLFVMFFLIGFGGEIVKAETFVSAGKLKYRQYAAGKYTFFQHIKLGEKDAYCLNSSKTFPGGVNMSEMPGLIPFGKKNGVIAIINAGTPSNLGITGSDANGKTYYLTQAAVWYYLNGIGKDGITQGFYDWIQANYSHAWNTLIDAPKKFESTNHYIKVNSNSNKLTENGNFLVSEDYTIDLSVDGTFTVSIKEGSAEGSCILYNSECKNSFDNIPKGAKFKIQVDKPDNHSGTVETTFDIKANNQYTVYDLKTYGSVNIDSGVQNVGLVTTSYRTLETSSTVIGDYENAFEVSLQKISYESGKKVAGALLQVHKEDGTIIGLYTSTGEGEANPSLTLEAGNYVLKEIYAPIGYVKSDEEVIFSVVNDNGTMKLKQGNDFVDNATISMKNKVRKFKFRKVDKNGNPVEGVKIEINSYGYGQTGRENHTLCAYTDSHGLLTQPCEGYDTIVKPTGVYILGEDFGDYHDIYKIVESCDEGDEHYEKCKNYDIEYFNRGVSDSFGVSDDGNILSVRPDVLIDISETDESIVNVSIVNGSYIEVSKVEIVGNGGKNDVKLLDGATLTVFDPEVHEDQENIIASWTSSSENPQKVRNLIVGKKYGLTEDMAPVGYIDLKTTIHFVLNQDGSITVYDPETGDEIKDLSSSDYSLIITNEPVNVQFSKVDATTGEEIEGAELKICTETAYKSKGFECTPSEKDWSWTSGKTTHNIKKLSNGKYYLIETVAPVGYYKKTSAVEFEVKNDGGILKVEMTNDVTKMLVTKLDQATKKRVGGAHFEILDASDRTIAKDYLGNELRWVSTTDSDWEILGIPAGDYILVETQNPENFQEGMIINGEVVNEYNFTINESEDAEFVLTVEVMNAPKTAVSTLSAIAIGCLVVFIGYQVIRGSRRKLYN